MVRVPEPSFVRAPAVEVLMPLVEIVVLALPPTVKANPVPVIPPVSVSVPLSELIRVAAPRVIAPLMELVPEMFRRAPALEMPVPLSVRASAPIEILPWTSREAPSVTLVPLVVEPNAVACCTFKFPAETVVTPS